MSLDEDKEEMVFLGEDHVSDEVNDDREDCTHCIEFMVMLSWTYENVVVLIVRFQ